jgi:hypothetical protein
MKTFIIDSDNYISAFASAEEITEAPGLERFDSVDQFLNLTEGWPSSRLVGIWNSLAGVKPVQRFTDRKTAVNRIWKAIQGLGPAAPHADSKPDSKAKSRRQPPHTGRRNTKNFTETSASGARRLSARGVPLWTLDDAHLRTYNHDKISC